MGRQPDALGDLVRGRRLAAGLAQGELASRAGVALRTVRDIELHRVEVPRRQTVRRLLAVLVPDEGERGRLLAAVRMNRAVETGNGLRIGVLGPLTVHRGGRPVEVRAGRLRHLLAVLAVQPRQFVPVAEIIDTVWGERPPSTCRRLVRLYAGQLRALLEPDRSGPARPVADVPGGYRLDIDERHLDLAMFDTLVLRARQLTADDPDSALAAYAEALDCWRGPVLADIDSDLRQHPAATAAAGRRVAATLAFADLAISARRFDEAAERLRRLVAEQPLHEALHARLGIALAGAGQQAAALQVFTDMRARLAADLGVEPGPELQAAQQRVLRHEIPGVTATSRPAGRDGPVVPAQLPADVASFTGRADHLRRLDDLLRPRRPDGCGAAVVITAIGGTAGVGKTALAVHWAHRVKDRFPDGQLYVNLRGFDPGGAVMDPAEAVRRFLDALGVPAQRIPADAEAQVGLYRTLLATRELLIVLDNARDPDQVSPLLPGAPGCRVLVTSRNRLSGLVAAADAHPISLDLLTVDEARDLLARRIGVDPVAAEPGAVDEIIACCSRLPLALAIVAANAATQTGRSLAAVAADLRDSNDRLGVLSTGDTPGTDVRAVFSWSYRTLNPAAARLFRLLGLHPGPDIATPAAASLAGLPIDQVRPLLAELARVNLLAEPVPGRYTFHDLLRTYAADLVQNTDPEHERRVATHRMLDHYLHTAYAAGRLLDPTRDPITLTPPQPGVVPEAVADHGQALAWFTAEHAVLLAAVDHAAATGFHTHTCQLAWAVADFLDRRGYWHDYTAVQQAAVAAPGRLADPPTQANAHRLLGYAYTMLGRFDDADSQMRHALDMYREADDRTGQARTHLNLCHLRENEGRFGEALHHARQALDLYRALGRRRGRVRALSAMGWLYARLGDHQRALTTCQQSLALHQELDDRNGQAAATWDSLGYAHHHLGHHTQALACYQHALDLCRELRYSYYEAEVLTHLGDTHHVTGDVRAARDTWQQALTILDELGHPDAEQVRVKLRTS